MMRCLPPVGRPLDMRSARRLLPEFTGFESLWLNSGTAALSVACSIARRAYPKVTSPKVILPAYGCPDLVAAAVFAGVTPVLVDIGSEDPGYDLNALEQALSDQVVAVIAVNFLGIRERVESIQALTEQRGILLIEDRAQSFPEELLGKEGSGLADMVLTSFGRGKPVNLMGGGLLLVAERWQGLLQCWREDSYARSGLGLVSGLGNKGGTFTYRTKAHVFNRLLHSGIYYWLNLLPFLKLGVTEYHPLLNISTMSADEATYAGSNIFGHVNGERSAELWYSSKLSNSDGVKLLPKLLASRAGRMLRYPLLASTLEGASRKKLLESGLGVSSFYGQSLVDIPSVIDKVEITGTLDGSRHFAKSLLTLPVHTAVREADLQAILRLLAAK